MLDDAPRLIGRDSLVDALRAELAACGRVWLRAEPGVGATAVARAVIDAPDRLEVDLGAADDEAGVVRLLGRALEVDPCGDAAGVANALATLGEPLLLDGVRSLDAWDAVRRLVEGAPSGPVVVVFASSIDEDARVVPPLSDDVLAGLFPGLDLEDCRGSVAVARLAAMTGLPPAELLARIARAVPGLVALPAGLRCAAPEGVPRAALLDDPSRTALRRSVTARIPAPPPDVAWAAALPVLSGLFHLADGGHVRAIPDPRDISALRDLAGLAPQRPEAALALAAAARLALACGQLEDARQIVRGGLGRAVRPVDRGILTWADADALLAAGEIDEALARWGDAEQAFNRVREHRTRAAMLRRSADRLAARSVSGVAERRYGEARAHYRVDGASTGVAATLRGASAVAVAAGEEVGAAALLEQAAAMDGSPTERANLQIEQAGLAIARGEYGRAEALLRAHLEADDLLLRANALRRAADLALRRGRPDAAAEHAVAAARTYARLAERAAAAGAVRLEGDAHAAAGRLGAAMACYERAVGLHAATRDLAGLARTLSHAAHVDEACGRTQDARDRRAFADEARVASARE